MEEKWDLFSVQYVSPEFQLRGILKECNYVQGGGTISGNRARPGKVHAFEHQIPAWELQHPQEIPHQRDHVDANRWGVVCEYSGHGGR